ncbi:MULTISPECIES: factor-independent urate hydroxylase [Streptomyces]|uniref:Uricase n=1 Tax=Streptomyces evansiae TaxID=3075535 RepID=A0ABU2R6L8_9ACTN|nr:MULTISPECIES: urate oxidase [unclassified Streptomyces]MDT0411380.1 urate oxidase [Streptomyces sp. DSM 41979]SCD65808.1 urate oxidase [Streptomyces sp. DfronAA-171]
MPKTGPDTTPEADAAPAPAVSVLGQNQYGKAEVRVVRVVREGAVHHLRDLNVSIALSGALDDVHLTGSNANCLPTDTMKNTVYVFAKEHGIASPEEFATRLARHFVTTQPSIHRARVRVEEYAWDRLTDPAAGPAHSFARRGGETRLAEIAYEDGHWQVISGLKGLTVLNTTDSEFHGFAQDPYTTLPETHDRILATEVSGRWRHTWTEDTHEAPDWDTSYRETRAHLLAAFAGTYSLSLQQTMHRMGSRIIEHRPEIAEVRFSLPNKHHFLVDLAPFGLGNDNEVYYAADRPYGLIEATILRAGHEARIPVDHSNL